MKNVKSVITTKEVYDLAEGKVLTRETPEGDFVYETEYIGKDHKHSTKVVISESLIDKDHFAAIEWFAEKPLTNKEKIAKLEKQLEDSQYECKETQARLDEFYSKYDKLMARIESKMYEYGKALKSLDDQMEIYRIFGGYNEITEAHTSYANMYKLLKEISK